MSGDLIRIDKTVDNGHEVVVVELFGETLAYSHHMVEKFDSEPDFAEYWKQYFLKRVVSVLVEDMHKERGVQGWSLPTRLAPQPPELPREGEEG